jgi:hypothetical protein
MIFPAEFPLVDNQGVVVIQDRRRLPDRRKAQHDTSHMRTTPLKMGEDNLEDLFLFLKQLG